jgi:GT2 family glycosyltransferase
MNILIICVNYNSYEKLIDYINSINNAYIYCSDKSLIIDIVVADNSSNYFPINIDDIQVNYKQYKTGSNLGYIGAVYQSLKELNISLHNYNYFIISNVDIVLDVCFFTNLLKLKLKPNIGWIAPCIYSKYENRDRNPKITHRPTRRKIKLLALLYKYPILYYLHMNTSYLLRKRFRKPIRDYSIYAGHGSCMIFTNSLLKSYSDFCYPSFLFGEEIFFAEILKKYNFETYYYPQIKVIDSDHVNTKVLPKKLFYKWNYNSINILIKLFFNE